MTNSSPSGDRWQRLWNVFHQAAERTSSERGAYLDAACSSDAELRREVGELLAADAASHSPLDLPPAAPGEWSEASAPVVLTDPYDVLLLKLGRGSDELGESLDVEVRVSAPDGSAIPGQGWNTMRPPGLPSDLDP